MVILVVLKIVKDYYKVEGKNFLIMMVLEFFYLKLGSVYESYLILFVNYYDYIVL